MRGCFIDRLVVAKSLQDYADGKTPSGACKRSRIGSSSIASKYPIDMPSKTDLGSIRADLGGHSGQDPPPTATLIKLDKNDHSRPKMWVFPERQRDFRFRANGRRERSGVGGSEIVQHPLVFVAFSENDAS